MHERFMGLQSAYEHGIITKDELLSNLFDHLIYAYTHGQPEQCDVGLDSLPVAVIDDLLVYARAQSKPRVFNPQSSDLEQARLDERAALAARSDLISRLQERLR